MAKGRITFAVAHVPADIPSTVQNDVTTIRMTQVKGKPMSSHFCFLATMFSFMSLSLPLASVDGLKSLSYMVQYSPKGLRRLPRQENDEKYEHTSANNTGVLQFLVHNGLLAACCSCQIGYLRF